MSSTDSPWDAGRKHLLIQNSALSYVDAGAGSPLLCLHGNPTWSYLFRSLILNLKDRARIVAPDHLGCGLSDKPGVYLSLEDRAEHVLALIEALDLQKITLVAHDWGGAIGLLALIQQPHRFQSMVLMNTGAWRPKRIPFRIQCARLPGLGRLAICGANLFQRAAFTMAVCRYGGLLPKDREAYAAPYSTWQSRLAMFHFVQDIPTRPSHPAYLPLQKLEAALPGIKLPTLLLWGAKDWCFDESCLQRFQSMWPHARVKRMEGAGHWVLEDAPDECWREIARFLETQDVASLSPNASQPNTSLPPLLAPN